MALARHAQFVVLRANGLRFVALRDDDPRHAGPRTEEREPSQGREKRYGECRTYRDNGFVAAETGRYGQADQTVRVRLLGQFAITAGGRVAGPWPRPTAKRLCELVLVSPGRRVSRDIACEELFPRLDPRTAARSLSKALSMARGALAGLGEPGASLLAADLGSIWVPTAVEVDAGRHEEALRAGLAMAPGQERDDRLSSALAQDAELLEDEPYADWAAGPRERLEALRQQARLALARDRAKDMAGPAPTT